MAQVKKADGTSETGVTYGTYVQVGVRYHDYAGTPRTFVDDHEQMSELERAIAGLRRQQAQLTLMGSNGVAELELQVQALTVELNVLKAQYGIQT